MIWNSRAGRLSSRARHVAAACALCCVFGCGGSGPELAPVTGVVTLDGKPVEGKQVSFTPKTFTPDTESGRSSVGFTDKDGRYELYYTAQKKGALITEHIVTIATPEGIYPPVAENIPSKYRIDTELTAVVEDTDNVINFPLESN
jgi:hypothetical protein